MKLTPIAKLADFWVGFYWDRKHHRLYILPLPCLGVCLDWSKPEVREPTRVTLRVGNEGGMLRWDESSGWPPPPNGPRGEHPPPRREPPPPAQRLRRIHCPDSGLLCPTPDSCVSSSGCPISKERARRPGRDFAQAEAELLRKAQQRAEDKRTWKP